MNSSAALAGVAILIVEDEPLIALDLQATLQAAGASVTCCKADDAVARVGQQKFSAAVLDARPGSSEHRPIARRLRDDGVPFLFYSTQAPEDVTTIRGAPVVLKPGRPQEIVGAVALLLGRNAASVSEELPAEFTGSPRAPAGARARHRRSTAAPSTQSRGSTRRSSTARAA